MASKNTTRFIGLNKLAADCRIEKIWCEANGDNPRTGYRDYWAELAPGWSFEGETHCLHEYTIPAMYDAMDRVVRCDHDCPCGNGPRKIRKFLFHRLTPDARAEAEACLAELRKVTETAR